MPRRRRRRRIIFLTIFLTYVAVMTFGGCADKFILHPSTNHIDARGATLVQLPREGGTTDAWVARSPVAQNHEPKAFVLEFTGNGTRAEQIASYVANRWGDHPVEAWTVNYPGYGGSTGPATLHSIPPMALAAFDAIAQRAAGRPIIVCGNSLGTTAALHVAANRPVAGVVLQNPPPLRQVLLGHFGWWNLWLAAGPVAMQIPSGLDSITNAANCHEPAVIITGQHDDYIPPKYHRMVIDAYAGPKRILEYSGGHNDSAENSPELHSDLEWLWKQATGE